MVGQLSAQCCSNMTPQTHRLMRPGESYAPSELLSTGGDITCSIGSLIRNVCVEINCKSQAQELIEEQFESLYLT